MADNENSNLAERLEATFDFFKPENLQALTLKYEGEVALVVIDVQKEFCDPAGRRGNEETEVVSTRIQSLVPEFRKAGIPVYAVYFTRDGEKPASEVDFYQFEPIEDDTLVAKNRDSAFQGGPIKDILDKDNKKLLLTCGFNFTACVKSTILDARQNGYDVCVLSDMVGNDNLNPSYCIDGTIEAMRANEIVAAPSSAVLKSLQNNQPSL